MAAQPVRNCSSIQMSFENTVLAFCHVSFAQMMKEVLVSYLLLITKLKNSVLKDTWRLSAHKLRNSEVNTAWSILHTTAIMQLKFLFFVTPPSSVTLDGRDSCNKQSVLISSYTHCSHWITRAFLSQNIIEILHWKRSKISSDTCACGICFSQMLFFSLLHDARFFLVLYTKAPGA